MLSISGYLERRSLLVDIFKAFPDYPLFLGIRQFEEVVFVGIFVVEVDGVSLEMCVGIGL